MSGKPERGGSKSRLIVGGAVVALVVAALAVGLWRDGDSGTVRIISGGPSLDGDDPAPAVAGPSLTSAGSLRLSDLRGKPVIINVWASWCPPCREEAPDIARFARKRPDVAVLGVTIDESRASARSFNAEVGWTHPSIFDPKGAVGYDALRVASLPATIYVDADGRVRGRTNGTVTYDDLVSVADRLR